MREARLPHYVEPDHRFVSGPSNNYPSPAIVLQRRSDALQRDPQSRRRARGQGGPELDQALFLRRRGADGRNEASVRSGQRLANRRRLLADGRDDGVLRQPGAGDEQDRIDRRAAA